MKAVFNYPTKFVTLPEYSAHRGCIVEVLRELGPDESDHHIDPNLEPVFHIRASDGWEGNAFKSELRLIEEKTK